MDRILVVDDEPFVLEVLSDVLRAEGFHVAQAIDGPSALEKLNREPFALVLSDIRMPGMDGFELVHEVRRSHPGTDIVMMSGYATIDGALEAMSLGAADYLIKPLKPREIVARIRAILERRELEAQVHQLQSELSARYDLHNVVAQSAHMSTVVSALRRVSPTNDAVLISGEKGTGRKFFARAIHYASPRRSRDFHCIRADLIPEERVASEIFGQRDEDGRVQRGALERFAGGSVHIHKVEALSPATQMKVAECLRTGRYRREGEQEARPLEARILISTQHPASDLIAGGQLHPDLQVLRELVTINLPALRHRRDDTPGLVNKFLEGYAVECGRTLRCSSQAVVQLLARQDFESNVEQLFAVLRHCATLSLDGELTPELVECALRQVQNDVEDEPLAMAKHLGDREYQLVMHAVKRNPGRLDQAARELGVSRTTLWRRMRKYGIKIGAQGSGPRA